MEILGLLGLICIAVGWIPQIIETIRTKNSSLNLGFALLYASGSLFLTIYSVQSGDLIFTILNGFALLMGLIGLYYTVKSRCCKKKSKK